MSVALPIILSLALGSVGSSPESVLRSLTSLQGGGFDPTPGKWIVLRIGPEPYRYMRVAVLGAEKTGRGEGRWLEVGLGAEPTGGSIGMKLLSVGDPRSGLNLQRVLYRLGMGATTELDPHEVEQMKHKLPTSPQAVASPNLKSDQFEDVTTFAGAFSCARLDLPGGHFWLSAEAPVFHLAKAALVDGTTLELFAMGEGATDTLGEVRAPPKRSLASTADAGAHR